MLFYAHLNCLVVGSHEKIMGAIGVEIWLIPINSASITVQALYAQILQLNIHHIYDIFLSLDSLSGVKTLNSSWLVDL